MERGELEKMTSEYQMLGEQLQSLAVQKEQLNAQKEEFREALVEIEKATGKIYLALGGAIVSVGKEKAMKSLKEKMDSADLRLTIVGKQHSELSKKEQSMRSEITAALKEMKQE